MFKFKRQSQGAELTSLHLGFQLGKELARKLCIPLYVPKLHFGFHLKSVCVLQRKAFAGSGIKDELDWII